MLKPIVIAAAGLLLAGCAAQRIEERAEANQVQRCSAGVATSCKWVEAMAPTAPGAQQAMANYEQQQAQLVNQRQEWLANEKAARDEAAAQREQVAEQQRAQQAGEARAMAENEQQKRADMVMKVQNEYDRERQANPYLGKEHWINLGTAADGTIYEVDIGSITRIVGPSGSRLPLVPENFPAFALLPPAWRQIDVSGNGEHRIVINCPDYRWTLADESGLKHIPTGSWLDMAHTVACQRNYGDMQ